MASNESTFKKIGRVASTASFFLALVCVVGCSSKEPPQAPPPPAVTVAHPESRHVTQWMDLTGNTRAFKTAELRARVPGYLEKVLFRDGETVSEGQLLFQIQQDTYQANLDQAEATILQLQAQINYATTEVKRFSDLTKQKAAAQTDLDNWLYQRDAARANLAAAKARRDLAKLDLSYTKVRAPFDGRIDRSLVDPGNLVGVGEATALAVLYRIDPVYAYFTINDAEVAVLEKQRGTDWRHESGNMPVFMGILEENGYPHQGRLDFASVQISPTTGTLELRGIFPNDSRKILPGLFARIRLPIRETTSLLVPQESVGTDEQGSYVLVVDVQNRVDRRRVKIGWVVDQLRVIEEGLTGEEWVVIRGIQKAVPGRQASPQRVELQTKAGS